MNLIKKYIHSFKIAVFLGCIFSTANATENDLTSAYLCIDSEVILPMETLEEIVNRSKQLMANTTLMVTNGKLLFFRQLYKNEGLFFSPFVSNKTGQFKVLTFENLTVAISTKNKDNVKNERYLCEFNSELSELMEHFKDDWPNRLTN